MVDFVGFFQIENLKTDNSNSDLDLRDCSIYQSLHTVLFFAAIGKKKKKTLYNLHFLICIVGIVYIYENDR